MREASTSAAASKGVHVTDILAVADWSGIPPSRDFINDPVPSSEDDYTEGPESP